MDANSADDNYSQLSENHIVPSKYKCESCIKCQNCGTTKAGDKPGQKWSRDFKFCHNCNKKREKKQYCPICEEFWGDKALEETTKGQKQDKGTDE